MIQFPRYRLDIDITFAQLGTHTKNAEIDIQMVPSATERMLNPLEWKVIPREAHIEIDNSAFREEYDIEETPRWVEKKAGQSRAVLAQETAWRARNGDLFYFATPGDLRGVTDYALHYFAHQDNQEINIDLTQHGGLKVTCDLEPTQRFQIAPLSDSTYRFDITASRAEVDIYLAVQPKLQIRATRLDERV